MTCRWMNQDTRFNNWTGSLLETTVNGQEMLANRMPRNNKPENFEILIYRTGISRNLSIFRLFDGRTIQLVTNLK